jgi:hypothetical protein
LAECWQLIVVLTRLPATRTLLLADHLVLAHQHLT